MANNTNASIDKLYSTDYVNLGSCRDRFEWFFWSDETDAYYLDMKLKVFKKEDNKDFGLNQNFTMAVSFFNQFMQMSNQLAVAPIDFGGEQILSHTLIPTMSKDMDEQLKLAHRVADFADRPNIKICVTMLRYSVDKPQSTYAQAPLLARK